MGGNSTGISTAFTSGSYVGPTSSSLREGGGFGGGSGGAVGGGALSSVGGGGSFGSGSSWEEFCERHARVAASEFAKACINFIAGNPPSEQAGNLSHNCFAQKYIETFSRHYESEFLRRRNNYKTANGSIEDSDYPETEHETSKIFPKAFFRRLSFKGLRKGKTLFHKNSESLDGTGKQSKTKMAKIVVECRKESLVNILIPERVDQPAGSQKWQRCRLALVKAVGGYMLEFFTPPKSAKPQSGVFCFLISEARETTELEMPDGEKRTFVLKADNNMEYVIDAITIEEMRSWLATIRYCMRTPPTQQPIIESDVMAAAMQTSPVSVNPTGATNAVQNPQYHQQTALGSNTNDGPSNSFSEGALAAATSAMHIHGGGGGGGGGGCVGSGAAVEGVAPASTVGSVETADILPRRPGERGEQRLSASSNLDGGIDDGELCNVDTYAALSEFPWFHGTLPRAEAARMVLHPKACHGAFLVRQSETRKGEFVLTFNFQKRAKHLRLTVTSVGQCRVQHLWFPSIQDMIEHFRHHPIPLESGGTSDVTLTDYVVYQKEQPAEEEFFIGDGLMEDVAGDGGGAAGSVDGATVNCQGQADGNGSAGEGPDGDGGHQQGHQQQPQNPSPRHPKDVITMNLSVKLKTHEIDLPFQMSSRGGGNAAAGTATTSSAVNINHQSQQQQQQQQQQQSHQQMQPHHRQVSPSSHLAQVQMRSSTTSLQSPLAMGGSGGGVVGANAQQQYDGYYHSHGHGLLLHIGAEQQQQQQQQLLPKRAVDNQYTFV